MNWLAHLYLARYDDRALLGALLGDFVLGSTALDRFGRIEELEIRVHRRVDRYTDAHADVVALRERFAPGQRRYAGIALDVYFDHLLARDWHRWCDEPLDAFSARVYAVLRRRAHELPLRLQRLVEPMSNHDWLGGYRDRSNVDRAVERIATRLSRHGERLVSCLSVLQTFEADAQTAFQRFFPQLIRYSVQARAELRAASVAPVPLPN